jgi:hypothetical protein
VVALELMGGIKAVEEYRTRDGEGLLDIALDEHAGGSINKGSIAQ